MSIRGISVDCPYGEDIKGTVAEVEYFRFHQDPCTQEGQIVIRWRVYTKITDALDGCEPVVEDSMSVDGNSYSIMTTANIDFDTFRESLYAWIMTLGPYAGGTKFFEVMP